MTGRAMEALLRRLERATTRDLPEDRDALVAQIGAAYRRALTSHGSHEAVATGLRQINSAAADGLAAMHTEGLLA